MGGLVGVQIPLGAQPQGGEHEPLHWVFPLQVLQEVPRPVGSGGATVESQPRPQLFPAIDVPQEFAGPLQTVHVQLGQLPSH